MLALPNLRVDCTDSFRQEAVAIAIKRHLVSWKCEHPTVFIIDEPWGYAYKAMNQHTEPVKIIMTSSPVPEYWQYLLTLEPNALLAGNHSLQKVLEAIKQAKPDQIMDMSPKCTRLLTTTESKVLWCLAGVKSNKQIAYALDIQEHTVANHLTSIFSKLGLANREEAMLYYWGVLESARQHGNAG